MRSGYTFIYMLLFMFFQSCQESTNSMPTAQGELKESRFLALGDSYTIGQGLGAPERWPNQLADSLNQRGYEFLEPEIIARTGWTTEELLAGIRNTPPDSLPYDLVSLLIGVNNQYRGKSLQQYRRDFNNLLGKAIEFAGGDQKKVVVLSIPDWGVTPFAGQLDSQKIASEIDAFNEVNKEESLQAGAYYIDITPISREAAEDRSLIAQDGLHPSGKMYARWVQLVIPQAELILKNPSLK